MEGSQGRQQARKSGVAEGGIAEIANHHFNAFHWMLMGTSQPTTLFSSASRLFLTSAQLVRKQAELAKLKAVTLPRLHYLIGRHIAELETLPPELALLDDRIKNATPAADTAFPGGRSSANSQPDDIVAKAQPMATQLTQNLFSRAADAIAAAQDHAGYFALGRRAIALCGNKAVPEPLQANMETAEQQIAAIQTEIDDMQESNAVGFLSPRRVVAASNTTLAILLVLIAMRTVGGVLSGSAALRAPDTAMAQEASSTATGDVSPSAEDSGADIEPNEEQYRLQEVYAKEHARIGAATTKYDKEDAQQDAKDVITLLGQHNAAREAGIDTADGVRYDEHTGTINGQKVGNDVVERHVRLLKDKAEKDPLSIVSNKIRFKLGFPLDKQYRPLWEDAEDLQSRIAAFGALTHENVKAFVEWGTPELAKKARQGDRFDREEIAQAVAAHQNEIESRLLWLQAIPTWDTRETAQDEPDTIRLRAPVAFKLFVSPEQPGIGVAAYKHNDPWYLTNDGQLARAYPRLRLDQLRAQNAVIYMPETLNASELLITINGDREFLKTVARQADSYVVNICLGKLRNSPVFTEGFFRLELLEFLRFDSDSVMRMFNAGNNGKEDSPNYFVAKDHGGAALDPKALRIPIATVKRFELVRMKSGKRDVVCEWRASDAK